MKKLLLISALTIILAGCKKSDIEIEIEQLDQQTAIYELRKTKLAYLKDLIEVRENMKFNERIRVIDSVIASEGTNLKLD